MKFNLKIGRRMNYNFNPRRKYLSFIHPQIWTNEDEEEMTMISRKFGKFFIQSKFNPLCFKCNKPDHIKKDCLLMKPKGNFKNFNKFNKKKKTFQATWDDSDSFFSDEK